MLTLLHTVDMRVSCDVVMEILSLVALHTFQWLSAIESMSEVKEYGSTTVARVRFNTGPFEVDC